ncbi:MAG: VanZ family protein [Lachnospiraceae bacterium]|nr:VanZ family protein [Lachnospiraceae bacterium]
MTTEETYNFINTYLPVSTWPILIFIGAAVFALNLRMRENTERAFLKAMLVSWFISVIFTTLVIRKPTDLIKVNLMPLWSWRDLIVNHNMISLQEIILNIILFIPGGILLHFLYRVKPKFAFLTGFIFSALIETLQLITHRGFFEWDDMLHNGFGCLMGAFFAMQILKIQRKDQ